MNVSNSEKLLRIPKWLMQIIRRGAHGFSYPKRSRILIAAFFVMSVVTLTVFYMLSLSLVFLYFMLFDLFFFGPSLTVMWIFPIVIRKDCFECQFGFHIIEHEKNHLRLNSLDEEVVEGETFRQTRNRLIPLLLSKVETCKGCRFRWYKMISESTSEYMQSVSR